MKKDEVHRNGNFKPGSAIPGVSVKFFAGMAESAGLKEIRVEVEQYTVAGVRRALENKLPQVASLLSRSSIAVDGRYGSENEPVHSESEIAVIPPVSGG